ncbi:hypothetical protein AB3S75_026200 [Citrus x aurantiifolia]
MLKTRPIFVSTVSRWTQSAVPARYLDDSVICALVISDPWIPLLCFHENLKLQKNKNKKKKKIRSSQNNEVSLTFKEFRSKSFVHVYLHHHHFTPNFLSVPGRSGN